MELKEKQELLWGKYDPRFHFTLPIDSFPVFDYLDALKADGAKVVRIDDSFNKRHEDLKNSINLAKVSRQYVGILSREYVDFATNRETLYVFQDGEAQALLTEFMTLSSSKHWNRQNHTHLELRDTYPLANYLVSLTLRELKYVGNSPLNMAVEIKRKP